MCTTCGCSPTENPTQHPRAHEHEHRLLKIETAILAKNDRLAADNRRHLLEQGVLALNLMSSPGAGKTTLLTQTIEKLRGKTPIAVIEGDQATANDAQRIEATGAAAIQINTGKACHLDAHGVGHALQRLRVQPNSILMIENVGNLVCPAGFDLGERHKVVVLSVTEGTDKPIKYPHMFQAAQLLVINKIDLLPYVDFDVDQCVTYARRLQPNVEVVQVSATTGAGMQNWLEWLQGQMAAVQRGVHQD